MQHPFRPTRLKRGGAGGIPGDGADNRRKYDVADPGCRGRVNGSAMLGEPSTDRIGADEEHAPAAG
jgi:hypothetical protein